MSNTIIASLNAKLDAKLDTRRAGQAAAVRIAEEYVGKHDPEARLKELQAMSHEALIALVLTHEKPKRSDELQSGELLKRIFLSRETVALDYETIATIVCAFIPEAKTSAKSARSIAHDLRAKGHVLPRNQ